MPDKPAPFSRPGWSEAERAARDSYGRLVAWLAYRWRDLAAAEDALSEALLAALTHWPDTGVPASPDAWLMAVAKRELLQRARHERVAQSPEVLALFDDEPAMPDPSAEPAALPDERLRLMFVCAHPSLPPAMHAPLMLQAVLGLDAKTIAQAFLIAPAAMAQRLVRAKAKIRDAGLRFEQPEARDLPQRLAAVLDSIYGAYTIGSDVASQAPEAAASPSIAGLTSEALYLAELTASLQSDSAEALALLALMRYCEARRPAQFDATGRFVPLTEQDTLRWDRALIHSAEGLLWQASQRRTPGPFQFEAAIQSAHCQRAFTGQTPWPGIAALYAALVAHFPSVGARLGQAVALAETGDVDGGLTVLDGIAAQEVRDHQPYWVALAHLRRRAGRPTEAAAALQRAIGLTADPRVREHLVRLHTAAT